jgi:hypothetical protein
MKLESRQRAREMQEDKTRGKEQQAAENGCHEGVVVNY